MEAAKELGDSELFNGLEAEDLAAYAGIAQEAKFGPEEAVDDTGSAGD